MDRLYRGCTAGGGIRRLSGSGGNDRRRGGNAQRGAGRNGERHSGQAAGRRTREQTDEAWYRGHRPLPGQDAGPGSRRCRPGENTWLCDHRRAAVDLRGWDGTRFGFEAEIPIADSTVSVSQRGLASRDVPGETIERGPDSAAYDRGILF